MTLLLNPTTDPQAVRVMADLDRDVFNFFFSATGDAALKTCRGARQALIAQFFTKLKAACEAEGIAQQWEPENENLIQDIMNRMTFPEKYTNE